jgi:membrane protease YdiL (CAAX protease family)
VNEPETGVAAREGGDLPALAMWPAGTPYPPAVTVAASCGACGIGWRIHRDLCGFRLRCRCGAWVDVPRLPVAPPTVAPPTVAPRKPIALREEIAGQPRRRGSAARRRRRSGLAASLAALRGVAPAARAHHPRMRAATAAFPQLVSWCGSRGRARRTTSALDAVASTAASLLVALPSTAARAAAIASWTSRARFTGSEASAVMGGAVLLALDLRSLLTAAPAVRRRRIAEVREQTGPGLALFTIALCPGIFEELAFRGLIQVRMTRLLGATQGLLVTAGLFAIAHGPQLGLPLQAGLGLYLCSLRARSGSIMPGILVHLGYNGALVLLH